MTAKTLDRNDTSSILPPDYSVSPDEITGTREEIAARLVVVRHLGPSIPCRSFLTGLNDHSPILAGVRDLTSAVFILLDAIDTLYQGSPDGDLLDPILDVRNMLEKKP